MENSITYIECKHGNLFKDCLQCENDKNEKLSIINDLMEDHKKDKRVPILRGCSAAEYGGGCFCTGRCKEIIGYRD